ncbi:MAG TPA: histidine kinase [Ruminiclostridium sp.]
MFREIYKNTIKEKMFNKIFIIYTLILVLTLVLMAFFFYKNLETSAKNEAIINNNIVIKEVINFFEEKVKTSKTALQKLYISSNYRVNIVNFLEKEPDVYSQEYSNFRQSTSDYLSEVGLGDESIQDVIILNCSNNKFDTFTRRPRISNPTIKQDILSLISKTNQNLNSVKIIPAFYPYIINQNKDNDIVWNQNGVFTVESYIKNANYSKVTGILLMNFSLKTCQQYFSTYISRYDAEITVLTENGDIIYDSNDDYSNSNLQYMNILVNSISTNQILNNEIIGINTSTYGNIIIVSKVALKNINRAMHKVRNTLMIILIFCITAATMLVYVIISRYSKRVNKVIQALNKVESGDLSIRVQLKGYDDEVGHIALSFNSMCDKLKAYIDKVYIADLKQKDAELYVLQSQINPHFLYNTLEVIRMKAVSNGNNEVGMMIRMMGELFRSSLKRTVIISFRDEFDFCYSLLELYNLRFGGILDIEFRLMDEVLEYGIPRHILQPLIENIIVHGIDPEKEGGKIILSTIIKDSTITVEVIDNGKGIKPEKLREIKRMLEENSKSDEDTIGIFNVNNRLRLIFGNEYGLAIDSILNEGVVTTITIPAKKVGELSNYVQNNVGG